LTTTPYVPIIESRAMTDDTMYNEMDREYAIAEHKITELLEEYDTEVGFGTLTFHISDSEELQSIIMLVCHERGFKYVREKGPVSYIS
jgi:hypothetical protein